MCFTGENRISKRLVLCEHRLFAVESEPRHIAFGDTTEFPWIPIHLNSTVLVVGQIRGQGIGDKNTVLARDDGDAFLERSQPVDDVRGNRAARQRSRRHDHIFVRSTAPVRGASVYRDEILLGDPRRQINVVLCEVFDHTDVSNSTRERTLPPCGDLVNLAEESGLNAFTGSLKCWVVPLDVTDAPD